MANELYCDNFIMSEDGENFEMTQTTKGEPGEGVPTGGTAGQVLKKVSDDDYDTEWADNDAGDVGYDPAETYQSGSAGAALNDLSRQLSDVSDDVLDLGTGIDYLQLENRIIVNIDSYGNRISVSTPNATNNNTKHLLCCFSLTGGEYDNSGVLSIEVSGYSQNGSVLYAQSPAPGNIAVPSGWKNSGIVVVVDVKLIGNIAIASIYMTNKSTQSTAISKQQVSLFASELKSLRTCILWHYMTASSANVYIVPDNTGAWSAAPVS